MSPAKSLIPNTSAFSRPVLYKYETQKELRLENQALNLDSRR